MDYLDPIMRWLVAPVVAFVWLLHTRTQRHQTDLEVMRAELNAIKTSHDREMKELRITFERVFEKLDSIEAALRK